MSTLIRLLPMPEELDRGYLGRIMRINGLKDERDAIYRIRSMLALEKPPKEWRRCMDELRLMAGMSEHNFVQLHTTTPLCSAFSSRNTYLFYESSDDSPEAWSSFISSAVGSNRSYVYFCRDCINEDEAFHGFSYWRRDHQIPGQLWCPKHRTALQFSSGRESLLQPPSSLLSIEEYVPIDWIHDSVNNRYVQISLEIATALYMRSSPLNAIAVSHALMVKAESMGMHVTPGYVKNSWLSNLILDSFPSSWISAVLPSIRHERKGIGRIHRDFDTVVSLLRVENDWSYILACAVLFDTSAEALQVVINASLDFQDSKKRETVLSLFPKPRIRVVDIEKIQRKKAESKLNSEELRKLISPGRNWKNRYAAVTAFYTHGKTVSECAHIGKLSINDMECQLRIACNKAVSQLRNITLDKDKPIANHVKSTTSANQAGRNKKLSRDMTPFGLNSRDSLNQERATELQN